MKAYVFPGQGSQYPGMAKDLYERDSRARDLFGAANEILGFSISDIMFYGTEEALRQTKVTQPAVFLHSLILAMCSENFHPDVVAGHSLGEFSALAAAGALDFEDALKLVSIRAMAMQKCCEEFPGTMAAIIGLPENVVEDICMSIDDLVIPANYNCEGQIVISGTFPAVEGACLAMKQAGAKRAIMLSVSGAFHSPLMQSAGSELEEGIRRVKFTPPICPIYQNVTALPSSDPDVIKANLLMQLTSPVRWTRTIKQMISDGVNEFIECGPGEVLSGLIRKISKENIIIENMK